MSIAALSTFISAICKDSSETVHMCLLFWVFTGLKSAVAHGGVLDFRAKGC